MGRKRHSDNSNEHDNKIPNFDASSPAVKKSKNELGITNGPEGKQDVDHHILTVESYGEEESRMITNEMVIMESYDNSLFSALAAFSHRQGNIENVDGKVVQKIRQHVVNFATRSTPSSFSQSVSVEGNYLHDKKDKDEYQSHGHVNSNSNHMITVPPKTSSSPIQSIWSKYCHLVYKQHHDAFEKSNNLPNNNTTDTMPMTLESKNETDPVHTQLKEMYKSYMLNSETPGSLLEVIFASMRYDLNAIVVQYLEKLNKFQVYNINPHLKNKIYLLNTDDIHKSGKWRNLEVRGFQEKTNRTNNLIPVGIYMKQRNDTSLVICQADATVFPASVTKFDSAFFTRLLLGTIKNEECTFHTENPEFHANNYILASEIPHFLCVAKHAQEQNEVQQIFKGRPLESHSVFPFKSKDIATKNNVDPSNIQSINELCQQAEQQPLTLNIMLDILNIEDELGVIQLGNKHRNALDHPKRFQNRETDLQCNKRQEMEDKIQDVYGSNNINYTGKLTHHVNNCESKLRFTRVKNNDQVAIAVIAKAEFGNPQILIQLRPDGKLTYKSNTTMYFMTLASSSICVQHYDFKRNQWQPSELKTGDFIINSDVCFRLHNTNKDMTQIRCSWFTKNTECNSNFNANQDQNCN